MKKIVIIYICLSIICSTYTVMAGGNIEIPKRTSVLYIDGYLDENDWAGVITMPANNLQYGKEWNNDAKLGLLWDYTYLYLGVIVKDKILNSVNPLTAPYADDCIEVFIDGDNHKGKSYNEFDHQYLLRWNDKNQKGGDFVTFRPDGNGVKYGFKMLDDGYTLELAIPWSSIGVLAEENMIVGFDINVDDNDTGERDAISAAFGTSNDYWDLSELANAKLSAGYTKTALPFILNYKIGQR